MKVMRAVVDEKEKELERKKKEIEQREREKRSKKAGAHNSTVHNSSQVKMPLADVEEGMNHKDKADDKIDDDGDDKKEEVLCLTMCVIYHYDVEIMCFSFSLHKQTKEL